MADVKTRSHMPIMALSYKADDDMRALRAGGITTLVIQIPWGMIAPHDDQAQRNHSQTLARLAERGGLGADEALAIIEGRRHERMTRAAANEQLLAKLRTYEASQTEPRNV